MVSFPDVHEVEHVAFAMAKKFLTWNEPIPDFSTRYKNVLESCLRTPQQKFGGKYLYPGLSRKAAMLFYLIIKNHPFQNGNKRIAVMTLIYFLHKNKKWINLADTSLYFLAVSVAASKPKEKPAIVGLVEDMVRFNLVSQNKRKK